MEWSLPKSKFSPNNMFFSYEIRKKIPNDPNEKPYIGV